jgi:hypothetical protein
LQLSTAFSFLDETEIRYFSLFQERTATELSGIFDTDIWSKLIPQVCYGERFALHAVIALGALDLTANSAQPQQQSSFAIEIRFKASIHRYEHALRLYRNVLKFRREVPEKRLKDGSGIVSYHVF